MTYEQQLKVLIVAARSSGLSVKAIAFIQKAGGKVQAANSQTTDATMDDLTEKVYREINNDDEEKESLHRRDPGESNWGDEASLFIQTY